MNKVDETMRDEWDFQGFGARLQTLGASRSVRISNRTDQQRRTKVYAEDYQGGNGRDAKRGDCTLGAPR